MCTVFLECLLCFICLQLHHKRLFQDISYLIIRRQCKFEIFFSAEVKFIFESMLRLDIHLLSCKSTALMLLFTLIGKDSMTISDGPG